MLLLFLMAIAPVLPWRKASQELLRVRLFWPAVAATVTVVGTVVAGAHGLAPVLAFGLGAFAGGAAIVAWAGRPAASAISRRGRHRRHWAGPGLPPKGGHRRGSHARWRRLRQRGLPP